jgi:hypothetical protein
MTLAFDAGHFRHFEIEDEGVGLELARLLQPDLPVLREAHHLQLGVAFDDVLDDRPHDEGIIDDEDVLGHCVSAILALGV